MAFEPGMQGAQRGMKSEETVQIESASGTSGPRHSDRGTRVVISLLAVRDDDVQAVDRSALKNRDQHLAPGGRSSLSHPNENTRNKTAGHECQSGRLEEESAIDQ